MADSGVRPGALVVCPTPIGNLGDVTLRALEELGRASVAACEDTRRSRTLLERHGISLPLTALHEHNERAKTPALLARITAGERICLLTDAGMPALSDPGAHLIREALGQGLEVVVLPGASAVTTALVASGMAGGGFVFVGFLPRTPGAIRSLLAKIDAAGLPVVAFESPRRLPATLAQLAGLDGERPVAVCRELTKLHEQVARGTAAELAATFATPPRGEIALVIGARDLDQPPLPDKAILAELAAALGAKRAVAMAAELTGLPRNRLYSAITSR
ncbi:MAG: rRNA (cytidine1402-2-O)-methyltransferase [Gaiellales bacterium]|jgi:16S rRNA (cytidine1402-2'-O)-methyltransferase|nr:rRNA (cytidine1402-2-O)-methyltransferase [Gaiellales bacterium]